MQVADTPRARGRPFPYLDEQVFDRVKTVESEDIERLRRSVAMLGPGHTAAALTREAAEALLEEVTTLRAESARYRQVVSQLRAILDTISE